MMDNSLQRLEEKVLILLTELENIRCEVQQLKQENSHLKAEKLNYTQKVHGLISLLDSFGDMTDEPVTLSTNYELEAMQRSEEYLTV